MVLNAICTYIIIITRSTKSSSITFLQVIWTLTSQVKPRMFLDIDDVQLDPILQYNDSMIRCMCNEE
jgi:hypothetical protein